MSGRHVELLVVALAGLLAPVAHAQRSWPLDAAKIYTAPDQPAISGRIVIANTRIESVAPSAGKRTTAAARAPECNGGVVVAGFQNSHVHFTGDEFRDARGQQAAALDLALTRMLTRYGYTTVFDIASDRDNTLALRDRIESVAPSSGKRTTAAARAPECNGGVVVAGFQNSHVHFTGDEFRDARGQQAAALDLALTRMLTRYGYTTVFDIASDRDNTLALRDRIAKGEVRGPRILTAGWALFPPHGLPIYIAHMRKELLDKLPQPSSVDEALKVVRENFATDADGAKLFLVTPQGDNTSKRMPPDIARAAADETHRRARLVFAHPTDIQGVQQALDAHVDILAHPPLGAPAPWPQSLLKQVRDARMSMIPTLKLLEFELAKEHVPAQIAERLVQENAAEFGKFAALGGQVLFGTDVGYMTDYDPAREYELMATAGLTPMQILASLTTTPAARWQEQDRRGRIAAGLDADMVVLDADPADSPRNFAAVRCVIRGGEVIYAR